jgi:hypothetical protein
MQSSMYVCNGAMVGEKVVRVVSRGKDSQCLMCVCECVCVLHMPGLQKEWNERNRRPYGM